MKMTTDLFCKNIKTLRESSGHTQESAAEAVGVNIRTYQRWESGETSPSERRKDKIAKAFNAALSDFYRDDSGVLTPSKTLSRAELLTEIYSLAPSLQEDQLKEVLAKIRSFT